MRLQVTQRLNHCTTADDMRSLLVGGLPQETVALPEELLQDVRSEMETETVGALTVCFALLCGDTELESLWSAHLDSVRDLLEGLAAQLRTTGDRLRRGGPLRVALRPAAQRSFPVCYFVMHRGQLPVLPLQKDEGGFRHVWADHLGRQLREESPVAHLSSDIQFLGDSALVRQLRNGGSVRSAPLEIATDSEFEADAGVVRRDRLFAVQSAPGAPLWFAFTRETRHSSEAEVLCFSTTQLHASCFAADNYTRRQNMVESAAATSPNIMTVLGMKCLGYPGSLRALTQDGSTNLRARAAEAFARLLTRARPECGNSRILMRRAKGTKRRRTDADAIASWEDTLEVQSVSLQTREPMHHFAQFAAQQVWELTSRQAACCVRRAAALRTQ